MMIIRFRFLPLILAYGLAQISFSVAEEEHDHHDHHGHDHDHHHHETQSKNQKVEQDLARLGITIEMVESRIINGKDVIAIPRDSLIREGNKVYIGASSKKDIDSFEKWEVTLGKQQDQKYIEAKTGVFPGDYVVVKSRENTGITQRHQADPEPEQVETAQPGAFRYPEPDPSLYSNNHRQGAPQNYSAQPKFVPPPIHTPNVAPQPYYTPLPPPVAALPQQLPSNYYICPHGNVHVIEAAPCPHTQHHCGQPIQFHHDHRIDYQRQPVSHGYHHHHDHYQGVQGCGSALSRQPFCPLHRN